MEFGTWRCDRSGSSSGSVTGGKGRLRASPGARRSLGENRLLFGDHESVGCNAETCVMVKATPSAAFVVAESDFLLEFEIIPFDPPPHLRLIDQALERDVGWQRGKPVVVRLGFALRPLDQQPLFSQGFVSLGVVVRRADPQSSEPRRQWRIAALPPGDLLSDIGGKPQGQRLDRDRPMRLVAAQSLGTPAAARIRRRRQWHLAGSPNCRAEYDTDRVR